MGTLLRTTRPRLSLLVSGTWPHGLRGPNGSRGLPTSAARAQGPLWGPEKRMHPSCWSCAAGARRYLLSDDFLGLRDFQQRKIAAACLIYGRKDSYLAVMEEKLAKHDLILAEDFKTAVHLCQTPVDAQLIIKLIYRCHVDDNNLLLGDFKFGPLVCRLFYELDMDKEAVQLLMDHKLKDFFRDHTSFTIVTDLLYEKGDYMGALDVIKHMRQRGMHYTKEMYLLVLALCYKLNTSESYKVCQSVLDDAEINGFSIARRGYCFAIMLAINQEDLTNAKALYSHILKPNSKLCLNLQVLLAAQTGSHTEMLHLLKSVCEANLSDFVHKMDICPDVLSEVRMASKWGGRAGGPDRAEELQAMVDRLERLGHVSTEPLDTLLCRKPRRQRYGGGQAARINVGRDAGKRRGAMLSRILFTE